MAIRDWLGRADRLQRSLPFKIVCSVIVLAIAIGMVVTYGVQRAAEREGILGGEAIVTAPPPEAAEPPDPNETPEMKALREQMVAAEEMRRRAMAQVLALRWSTASVGVGAAMLAAVGLGVVWIGKTLTALAIGSVVALLAFPLRALGDARVPVLGVSAYGLGSFIGAVSVLAFSFSVLMEVARLLLSGPWALTAIARNVINEAVRQKVSVIFIVMLILALAALPGLLNEDTPLRYRVQSFLQYGTGGAFWIIAVLVVTLSVATVAFEQRDKVIWQTMTKPVAAWQYLLGKWIGVMAVAGALLAVSASGIFLFTEYLKDQRAVGEIEPYRPQDPNDDIVEDRDILFNQVLSANVSRRVWIPQLDPLQIQREVAQMVETAKLNNPDYKPTQQDLNQLTAKYIAAQRDAFLALEPGADQAFEFRDLRRARDESRVLVFRYKVNIGTNDPRDQQWVTFTFPNFQPESINAPAAQMMTMRINPAAISEDGVLRVLVGNYRFIPPDTAATQPGAQMISFPPDGLEVSYAVGSYRTNFFRVMLVLWMKLGFLSMVGIAAATCLSFPVACLVAFGTFLIAEGSAFLATSLQSFSTEDTKGNPLYFNKIIEAVATPIARGFSVYGNLRPTSSLVEGRLLPWSNLMVATIYMGVLILLLYAAGTIIFRRRELATYSGQ